MKPARLFWKLYPTYFLVTLASLFVAVWLMWGTSKAFYIDQLYSDLKAKAQLISRSFSAEDLESTNTSDIESFCNEMGKLISTRITVILPNGKVICDSHKDPRRMDNHAGRPEVEKALGGHIGTSVRYSHTLQTEMMYVALPMKRGDEITAVIRTSTPLSAVKQSLMTVTWKVLSWAVAAAFLAGILSFFISRRISRPLEELTGEVQRFPLGGVPREMVPPKTSSKELLILADAVNEMTTELHRRMKTIEQHRSQLKTILSSMAEGILATDSNNRILVLNEVAGKFLGIDPQSVSGRFLEESVRNHTIQEMATEIVSSAAVLEKELVIGETILKVQGMPLQTSENRKPSGILMVMNDVTRLRQMEQVRKDFVANVSHELKTPITAIKGFAETLLDGALEDRMNAERFLEIIASHAERMERIVQDLLTLSHLEQDDAREDSEVTEVNLMDIAMEAIAACQSNAEAQGIQVRLKIPRDLTVHGNPRLLEQALINLVDNAVKYSGPGTNVWIAAQADKEEIILEVQDEGCGIEPQHLSRIFERFYRVDKARSRKLGGTGLGLAIVKHVAQIHGGHVNVDSKPGQGSVFSIHIPKSAPS